MTRSEMITAIAKQANCSKRLVRKKLFQLSSKVKRQKKRCIITYYLMKHSWIRIPIGRMFKNFGEIVEMIREFLGLYQTDLKCAIFQAV